MTNAEVNDLVSAYELHNGFVKSYRESLRELYDMRNRHYICVAVRESLEAPIMELERQVETHRTLAKAALAELRGV